MTTKTQYRASAEARFSGESQKNKRTHRRSDEPEKVLGVKSDIDLFCGSARLRSSCRRDPATSVRGKGRIGVVLLLIR